MSDFEKSLKEKSHEMSMVFRDRTTLAPNPELALKLEEIGRWAREWLREDSIMKLAGISTACIQNTEKTIKDRIDKTNPYWTVAYGDVCDTVDREMKLRTSNAKLTAENQSYALEQNFQFQRAEKLRGALEFIIAESDSMGGGMRVAGYVKAKQALAETGGDGG